MKRSLILASFLAATSANAQGAFTLDELHAASKAATATFSDDNPSHVEHVTGYKTWKSGADAKVKIYVSHGSMTMEHDYVCRKTDAAVECQEE